MNLQLSIYHSTIGHFARHRASGTIGLVDEIREPRGKWPVSYRLRLPQVYCAGKEPKKNAYPFDHYAHAWYTDAEVEILADKVEVVWI
jgi:hypothetical protein